MSSVDFVTFSFFMNKMIEKAKDWKTFWDIQAYGKSVVCLGAGGVPRQIANQHPDFLERICFFVDNACEKWGKNVLCEIDGKGVPVHGFDFLLKHISDDMILLITTYCDKELVIQIEEVKELSIFPLYVFK